jgi:nicotinamide-nucleotide amidase
MQAVLLSIGDELILGQTVDTNTAWIAERLLEWGVMPLYHLTVADDLPAITAAFKDAAARAPLVIATGGLGPTEDDLTREALAAAVGQPLVTDEKSLAEIRAFFARRSRPMAERNALQAMLPNGARPLPNSSGTAPGMHAQFSGCDILVFPGVPSELKAMFDPHAIPLLQKLTAAAGNASVILTAKVNTYGDGESNIAARLGPALMRRDRHPLIGTTVADGIVSVRVRSQFPTREQARRELDATLAEVRAALGSFVFSLDQQSLAQVVTELCIASKKTLAVAESCTGGLLGSLITEVPGSSAMFRGGWIVYSNDFKNQQLDVPLDVLQQHGAVSEATALALAENALKKADADFALAITGVAGPTGGTPDKPVGTVWIALAERHSPATARLHNFPGDREMIRDRAAKTALNTLRLRLQNLSSSST